MSVRAEWAKEDDYKPRHILTARDEVLSILYRDTSRRFHDLMDAAMLVSGMPEKYGPVADAYPENVRAVAITDKEFRDIAKPATLEKRLRMYRDTGNVEYLVDVANMAMIEFCHPRHPKAHYKATDASGSPGRANIAGLPHLSNAKLAVVATDYAENDE